MRAKRSRAPSIEAILIERRPVAAGASRAAEPVFEQIAREAHLLSLVRSSHDAETDAAVEQWLVACAVR